MDEMHQSWVVAQSAPGRLQRWQCANPLFFPLPFGSYSSSFFGFLPPVGLFGEACLVHAHHNDWPQLRLTVYRVATCPCLSFSPRLPRIGTSNEDLIREAPTRELLELLGFTLGSCCFFRMCVSLPLGCAFETRESTPLPPLREELAWFAMLCHGLCAPVPRLRGG